MRFSRLPLVVVYATLSFGLAGCQKPPGDSLATYFRTPLPTGITVDRYFSEPYGDPAFLWVFSPISQEFLDALIANAGLKRAQDGKPVAHVSTAGYPDWWKDETVRAIPELYFHDTDPADRATHRVWVDRSAGKLYVLYQSERRR